MGAILHSFDFLGIGFCVVKGGTDLLGRKFPDLGCPLNVAPKALDRIRQPVNCQPCSLHIRDAPDRAFAEINQGESPPPQESIRLRLFDQPDLRDLAGAAIAAQAGFAEPA